MTVAAEEGDFRRLVFKYRSYAPIPFLLVMVWYAEPTPLSLLGGIAIVAAGEFIRFWGVSIAGAETRTTGRVGGTFLITIGPFAYVRNPLYVGNMLLYAGIGLMSMALFPWLLLVAVAWFYIQYSLIVSNEEEYLADRFGDDYAAYRKEVRRFLPRLTPFRSLRPAPKSVDTQEGLASEKRTLQAIVLVVGLVLAKYVYLLVTE
ncbi:MAG: isoprenylcysteine carboxylmethyltransferase family protein [Bacteroidota bacterium]